MGYAVAAAFVLLLGGAFASAMNQRSELGAMRFRKFFDRRILLQNGKCGLTVDIAEKLLKLRKNELNNVVHSHFSFSEIFCNKISFSCYGL